MFGIDKFMNPTALLEHPYKVGEQMAYLQSVCCSDVDG